MTVEHEESSLLSSLLKGGWANPGLVAIKDSFKISIEGAKTDQVIDCNNFQHRLIVCVIKINASKHGKYRYKVMFYITRHSGVN